MAAERMRLAPTEVDDYASPLAWWHRELLAAGVEAEIAPALEAQKRAREMAQRAARGLRR